MSQASLAEWNIYLQNHPEAHLLQTGEWGELKAHFGWSPLRIVHAGFGAQVLFRRLPLGLTIAYLPKPLAGQEVALRAVDRSSESAAFWAEIDNVCRARHAAFLKTEPDAWEEGRPPRTEPPAPVTGSESTVVEVSPHNIQPPRTILVDLRGSEAEMLGRMKQKCRYNIRLAERKGITIRAWHDLPGFHRLMTETGGRDGFGVHSLEYYTRAYELFHTARMAELLVAEYQGAPLAALMVFARGKRSWYLYGASTDLERKRMPSYLLQWEAMKWARARGAESYDLWGVPDEDEATLEAGFETRTGGLWGVYRFKRGFGGTVVRAVPASDRIYSRWLYRIYRWRYRSLSD